MIELLNDSDEEMSLKNSSKKLLTSFESFDTINELLRTTSQSLEETSKTSSKKVLDKLF